MSFLYPFINFLQPGMLWPDLASLRPMLVVSALALLAALWRHSTYERGEAWRSKEFVWLVVFVIAQGLSVYKSGAAQMLEELGFWYVFLLYVAVSVVLIRDEETLSRYVWGTMIGSLVVVVYGLYAVPAWGGYMGTGRAGAYGMYENHNDYTFIIIQSLPYLYMFWRREAKVLRRLLLMAGMLACVTGVAMSMSRGGIIALVLEVVLIVIIGQEGRRRWWLLPLIIVLGAGAVSVQYARRAANQGEGYTAEDAEESRLELWRAGWRMVLANPVLGVGSRRFPEYAQDYYDLSYDQKGKVSHNTYIEVASTSGLIGFLSFILMGWRLIQDLRRTRPGLSRIGVIDSTRRATLIGIYAMMMRAFLDAKPYDWSFYTFCAIGIACCRLRDRPEQDVEVSADPEPVVTAGYSGAET